MNQIVDLPSLLLYRRNCHSYEQKYFCYLSSTTQFKIVQFTNKNTIANFMNINIPLQPVRGICMLVYKQRIYTAVAFLTRMIIFEGNQVYFESSLKLDANIVSFENGFSYVAKYSDNNQKGFIFVTKNGHITIFNLQNKNRIFKMPAIQPTCKIQSLVINYPNFYLGTDDGSIKKCKIQGNSQHYQQISTYDTTSKLPIINLALIKSTGQIIATTCEGQIHLISADLSSVSVVSAHRCLISRLMIHENNLYTSGEDFTLNKFQILGNRKLKLVSSQNLSKLISVFLTVNGKCFASFYQAPRLKQI